MKVAVARREVSNAQSPLAPVHVLVDKSAPSDLAETMNNEAVRALLKATIAAMELHELVDPPASTSAPGREDDR